MSKKGDDTKRMIRTRSRQLFEKSGFHQVTMKDICIATGLSRGGLYGHYQSTGQIFAAIMAEFLEQQNSEWELQRSTNVTAAKILADLLDQYAAEMKDGEHSLSLAIYEYYSQFPDDQENELVRQYQKSQLMWRQLLHYGMETGEFQQMDVDGVYDLIAFSYQGVRMYSEIVTIDATIPERIVKTLKDLILKKEVSDHDETEATKAR